MHRNTSVVGLGLSIYFLWPFATDTLAWATGARVGAGDHSIAFFCIEYGCVLGLYSDALHFAV